MRLEAKSKLLSKALVQTNCLLSMGLRYVLKGAPLIIITLLQTYYKTAPQLVSQTKFNVVRQVSQPTVLIVQPLVQATKSFL